MINAIKKYDALISLAEKNIELETKTLVKMACAEIVESDRKMNEFFQNMDLEGRGFRLYVKSRKHLRAMGEFSEGKTTEQVCEKYNLDTSKFSGTIKGLVNGKTPSQLRKEGYSCPPPVYLSEYFIKKDPNMDNAKQLESNEEKYIDEIIRLEDKVFSLQINNIRETKAALNETPLEEDTKGLDYSEYMQFLEIEEKRIVYGFSVGEILSLYHQSIKEGKSFDQLCDEAQNAYLAGEAVPSFSDEIERFNYHMEYEWNTGEAYDYYFGDDDAADLPKDPYADNEYGHDGVYEKPDDIAFPEDYNDQDELTEEDERIIDQIETRFRREEIKNRITGTEKEEKKPPNVQEEKTHTIEDDNIPF